MLESVVGSAFGHRPLRFGIPESSSAPYCYLYFLQSTAVQRGVLCCGSSGVPGASYHTSLMQLYLSRVRESLPGGVLKVLHVLLLLWSCWIADAYGTHDTPCFTVFSCNGTCLARAWSVNCLVLCFNCCDGSVVVLSSQPRVRAKGADLETVNPQALEGVPDAMSVSNLTQASLLHTVRERYNRDEVSVGVSISVSVNCQLSSERYLHQRESCAYWTKAAFPGRILPAVIRSILSATALCAFNTVLTSSDQIMLYFKTCSNSARPHMNCHTSVAVNRSQFARQRSKSPR